MSPLTLFSDAILLTATSPSFSVGNVRIGAFVPLARFLKKTS